jgi:cation:H+ antiporter
LDFVAHVDPGVVLLLGLGVLLGGGEFLVRGATALAQSLGVSPLVIGLTVVAFGTSAPELAVNVSAALSGNSAITFGNVVGSNIANIGLILGLTALLHAMEVKRTLIRREIPIMLGATAITILLGFGILQGNDPPAYGRLIGAIFLAAFVLFLVLTTRRSEPDPPNGLPATPATPWIPATVMTLAGLGGVLLGSHWTVQGASQVALNLGVGQELIGLTIVAVGTSLPELTTSLFAARKGHADLAIGNIIGSNIFNLLFILGVSATIRPVPVPERGQADLLALGLFSFALLPFARSQKKLSRTEGILLLGGYVAYMSWRSFS